AATGRARRSRAMSERAARYEIVHVDLAAPLRVVGSAGDVAGLHLIFWFDGLPLGRCEVAPDALPLSVAALAALASQTAAPAVGARLFAHGFAAPMPAEDEPAQAVGDVAAVLACERPLGALRRSLDTEVPERTNGRGTPHAGLAGMDEVWSA